MYSATDTIGHEGLVAAVEQAADSIVITDKDGNIQYVNPAFTVMTGYSGEEAVSKNPRLLKSGHQSAAFYEELWSTILSGRVWRGELTNRRKDGTFYNEEMRIAPVLDASGATTGYVAVKRDVTERRAAQDAQAFLAAIVEGSQDAILSITPAGAILTFNRGAEALLGFTSQQVIGQNLFNFVPRDQQSGILQCIGQVLQGRPVSSYEGICQHVDGRRIPFTASGFPIKDAAGRVVAATTILKDLTERCESEQELRESEERFREVFEGAPVGMCVAGQDGRHLQVNSAYCQMLGYSEEELLRKTWAELCHPDDLAYALSKNEQLWKGSTGRMKAEGRFIHRNGTVVWCQVTISLLRIGDGRGMCPGPHG